MSQAYSDPKRASDPYALPDVEVFRAFHGDCPDCGSIVVSPDCQTGACHDCRDRITVLGSRSFFWWPCFPGCLPDSDPVGPFETEAEALADAQEGSEDDA